MDLVRSEDKTTNLTDPVRAQTCVIVVNGDDDLWWNNASYQVMHCI